MRKTPILALVLFTASVTFAHHGPKTVKVDAAAKKQPAVVFNHEKHAGVVKGCDTCHHTQKGMTAESTAKVVKCSTCHLDPKDKAPSMREMSLTKNPFHTLCIDCHKKEKKGPTVCKDCHKK